MHERLSRLLERRRFPARERQEILSRLWELQEALLRLPPFPRAPGATLGVLEEPAPTYWDEAFARYSADEALARQPGVQVTESGATGMKTIVYPNQV